MRHLYVDLKNQTDPVKPIFSMYDWMYKSEFKDNHSVEFDLE